MILLEKITKSYTRQSPPAVESVTLTLPDQMALVIVGHSGSGKTTLLRLIAGLELPDQGTIWRDGEVISAPGWALAPHRRAMGFLFQTPALWPHLTVRQNIAFGLGDWPRAETRLRLEEILAQTGLAALARRFPHQLSGGEAQRVSLARALAPKPACLLLDEPLTHLDADLKAEMLALILQTAQAARASIIYVTHDLPEAQGVSQWVGRMSHGRLELQAQVEVGGA